MVGVLWILTLWQVWDQKPSFLAGATSGRPVLHPQFRPFDQLAQRDTALIALIAVGIGVWSSLVSIVPLANLSVWLQIVTGPVSLGAWIWWQRKNLAEGWVAGGILASSGLQTSLAWWQWFQQQSLGGYWLLGQPDLGSAGIAHSSWTTTWSALPYGSSPHPNVLAAWLVLGILALTYFKNLSYYVRIIAGLLLAAPLIWTESWAAWLTVGIIGLVRLMPPQWRQSLEEKPWRSVAVHLIGAGCMVGGIIFLAHIWPKSIVPTSLSRRAVFLEGVPSLWADRPQGWGLLQHPTGYPPQEKALLSSLSRQPVHAAPISAFLDLGFCSILLLFIFPYFGQLKYPTFLFSILIILPLLYLDHWIYSTISGQNWLILFLLFFKNESNKLSPIYRGSLLRNRQKMRKSLTTALPTRMRLAFRKHDETLLKSSVLTLPTSGKIQKLDRHLR